MIQIVYMCLIYFSERFYVWVLIFLIPVSYSWFVFIYILYNDNLHQDSTSTEIHFFIKCYVVGKIFLKEKILP